MENWLKYYIFWIIVKEIVVKILEGFVFLNVVDICVGSGNLLYVVSFKWFGVNYIWVDKLGDENFELNWIFYCFDVINILLLNELIKFDEGVRLVLVNFFFGSSGNNN